MKPKATEVDQELSKERAILRGIDSHYQDAVFNWIDSQIVWWWIQADSRCFKQFVQNRVQKIRSLWSKEHWWYFPTDLNLSEVASRDVKSSESASSDLKGPGISGHTYQLVQTMRTQSGDCRRIETSKLA